MLHRPGRFGGRPVTTMCWRFVSKQRNGPTGEISLTWHKQFNRYENYIADVGYSEGTL